MNRDASVVCPGGRNRNYLITTKGMGVEWQQHSMQLRQPNAESVLRILQVTSQEVLYYNNRAESYSIR